MAKVRLIWKGRKVVKELMDALDIAIIKSAKFYAFELRKALLARKGSYQYNIHSAPGEIPYYISTRLASSVKVIRHRRSLSTLYIDIKVGAKHHKFLEHGTKKMQPRPHVIPIFEKNKKEMRQIILRVARAKLIKGGTVEASAF